MPSNISQLFLPVAMIAAVWFLLIRPQQKRAKEQAAMLATLEPGAEIVTIGGIYGEILEVGEDRILIETIDGSQLEIARRAVSSITQAAEEEDDEEDDEDDEALEAAPDDAVDTESADEPADVAASDA
jgi:preprotein translocase subunit YajC